MRPLATLAVAVPGRVTENALSRAMYSSLHLLSQHQSTAVGCEFVLCRVTQMANYVPDHRHDAPSCGSSFSDSNVRRMACPGWSDRSWVQATMISLASMYSIVSFAQPIIKSHAWVLFFVEIAQVHPPRYPPPPLCWTPLSRIGITARRHRFL